MKQPRVRVSRGKGGKYQLGRESRAAIRAADKAIRDADKMRTSRADSKIVNRRGISVVNGGLPGLGKRR